MKRRTLAAIVRIAGKRDELLVVDKGHLAGNAVAGYIGVTRLAVKLLNGVVELEAVRRPTVFVVLCNGVVGILLSNIDRTTPGWV